MNKIFLLFLIILTGCASPRIALENKPIPFVKPPLPAGIDLREVEWQVLSVNTNAWFALDTENYLGLSKNMVDIAEYIQKLRIVTEQYQTNYSKNRQIIKLKQNKHCPKTPSKTKNKKRKKRKNHFLFNKQQSSNP